MEDIQAVLSALEVFNRAPDKTSLERANSWLQDFQHSPESWSTCNILLLSPEAPPAAKLFAAQTFRTKVTYDLNQVDAQNLVPLRDTLLTALEKYQSGPRAIIVQLSLAIAGYALQTPSWENPVLALIDSFGRNPGTVPALLEFLTQLPDEVNGNTRIPISDSQYRERAPQLLTANAQKVLELLTMYITASGVTSQVQTQIFHCLHAWLVAGEIPVSELAETPLLAYAFEALGSDELFDPAVDVICQIIHETQEIDESMPIIELLVPRIIALRPMLAQDQDDPEKIKGFARIFSEAGETYRMLLLQHTETFFPIVEAIGECAAYPDLDIVPITFPFWMRLAQIIGKRASIPPLFIEAYKSLMSVIIRHLVFPPDMNPLTGQEAENFRSFRHVMGDTLKDCCFVLRTETCLLTAYQLITIALARGPDVSWQEIEAPLFAMRSMGAEIDLKDDNAVPKIMDLIPLLPNHPRVKYAALLILARYTEWINDHPQYIQFQLQYIAAGFEDADQEVNAAAGQALKYLCQDCRQHLTEFLPMLHTFLTSVGPKLQQEDRRQVYEAIAYVISAMPMARAAESLKTFSVDILAQVHAFANKTTAPTKAEIEEVGNGLENLETMLHVIQGYGDELPPACQSTATEAWSVFDQFLTTYGLNYDLAERATRVLRRGIDLFGKSIFPLATSVIARMSVAFQATGFPSFLWIAGKFMGRFGHEKDPAFRAAMQELFERSTDKVGELLQTKNPREIPDVLEDYLQMLLQLLNVAPDVFFVSASFPVAFRAALSGLEVVHSDIVFATLDLLRNIVTHDSLDPQPSTPPPAKFALYSKAIQTTVNQYGAQLTTLVLKGVVGDFPEDSSSSIVSIFRGLAQVWPSQLLTWIPQALETLPPSVPPLQARTQFLQEVNAAIHSRQFDKVKYAVLNFDRASRKTRDRRRQGI
ncbi:hypothetical protein CVT24_000432 [Panaeolus cyanescens]|uniref:Importin N-terminal domain-containing protein n=1 Tax=Panaeolus cyanescens TaxID=181874 RepID=A0A409V8A8_9AGAR|nr:hypothetical protein CVT24_000432 [Panaeolus cyanescens]